MKRDLNAFDHFNYVVYYCHMMPGCMDSGETSAITVSPENAIIVPGASQQFQATAHFSDGTTLDLDVGMQLDGSVEDTRYNDMAIRLVTYGLAHIA